MDIKIKNKKETDEGWEFNVEFDGSEFKVEVEEAYWKSLTDGEIDPEELVEKSFNFLIDREPKSAIMREFNLKVINNYFPDYEDEIIN